MTCLLIASACGKKYENKVIFLNHIPNTLIQDITIENNLIHSEYELNADEDALYAFCIAFNCYSGMVIGRPNYQEGESQEEYISRVNEFQTQKVLEMLEGKGLQIISDYPYCFYTQSEDENWTLGLCTVAGTMEQIEEIFDGTEPISGFCWRLWSAPRPDYLEKMRKAGWDGNLTGEALEDWVYRNFEKMKRFVGDKNQVTMKVDFETVVEET